MLVRNDSKIVSLPKISHLIANIYVKDCYRNKNDICCNVIQNYCNM
jgi:hypothetical protein